MSRANLERRIEKLENQLNGDGKEADLYDWYGKHVDARVVKWPTDQARGLAIMPDGSRREIAATINLLDIIRYRRKQRESGEESPPMSDETRAAMDARNKDTLYLRIDGKPGLSETLNVARRKRDNERSEV